MAIVKGTKNVDKFTVNESNVIVVTDKKSTKSAIAKNGKNKIYGAATNDIFTVKGGKKNYIYGDAGNDTITVTSKIGTGNKIYGDDAKEKVTGNDTFNINGGNKNYFYGGKGTDTFNINGGSGNILDGGAGKDTFVFGKKKATATIKNYAAGQDTLKINKGTITSTTVKGKDVAFKAGSASVTLAGAATKAISLKDSRGSYTVSNTTITLGKGFAGTMDATKFLSSVKTIDGRAATKAVNITGNAKDNIIYAGKAGGTIEGGKGADTIYAGTGKDKFIYANGDGTDTIKNYAAGQDALSISSGSISKTVISGKNVVFTIGKGTVTVENASEKAINLKDSRGNYTASNATIKLDKDFSGTMDTSKFLSTVITIDGSAATGAVDITDNANNNLIYASKGGGIIQGGSGNDDIYGNVGTDHLYGGTGDDTIYGGAGNDELVGDYGNDTLDGGAGDDILYGGDGTDWLYGGSGTNELNGGSGADTFVYDGKGNDVIRDYIEDVIEFTGGIIARTGFENNNFVYTFDTGKTLTLENVVGKDLEVKDKNGSYELYAIDGGEYNAISLNSDYAGTFDMNIYDVDFIAAHNAKSNINIIGNARDNSIYGGDGNDTLNGSDGNDILSGGNGNNVLIGGQGQDAFYLENRGNTIINDYAEDEDILTFYNNSIVSNTKIENNNVIFTISNANNVNDEKGTVTLANAAGKIIRFGNNYSNYEDFTVSATTIQLGEGYRANTVDSGVYFPAITTIDASAAEWVNTVIGNNQDNIIYAGNFGGTYQGGEGNDTFYSGSGNNIMNGGAGNDTFVYCGNGNTIIQDYTQGQDTLEIANKYISKTTLSGANVVFMVGNGSVTVENGFGKTISLKDSHGSYTMSDTAIILGADYRGDMFADNFLSSVTLIDGRKIVTTDHLVGNSLDNTIYAGNMGGMYEGGSGNDTLVGGLGNDGFHGGEGDDTLTGGEGADMFIYGKGDGNDIITDYNEMDTITVYNGYISNTTLANNGKDVVFTVGDGTFTLQNAAGKTISLKDGNGSYTVSDTAITLEADVNGNIDANNYLNTVTTIDGRNAVASVNIAGNEQNNCIYAGKAGGTYNGGGGDDTLFGGTGNDTLTGGIGADIFVYANGGGNDVITDYEEGIDTVTISSGSVSSTMLANNDKDVVFSIGDGTLTLQNAAGKTISLQDSCGSYTVSDTAITLGADFKGDMFASNYLSTVITIDGQNSATSGHVIGNAQDNIIYVGNAGGFYEGGAGNDTFFFNGSGSARLLGGAGSDTFVYTPTQAHGFLLVDYTAGDADVIEIGKHEYTQNGESFTVGKVISADINYETNKDIFLDIGIVGEDPSNHTTYGTIELHNSANTIITICEPYSGLGKYYLTSRAFRLDSKCEDGGEIYLSNYMPYITHVDAQSATGAMKITGNTKDNSLEGGSGNDTLYGLAGMDNLYGHEGNDTLYGGEGNDVLEGGEGNDTLYGGDGNNSFFGSSGNDIFCFNSASKKINSIHDYESGLDIIRFENGVGIVSTSVNDYGDVLLNLTTGGKIDIRNVAGQNITFDYGNGNTTTRVFS